MAVSTNGIVFITMIIVLILNSISQGTYAIYRGFLQQNDTEITRSNSTGKISLASLNTYVKTHPDIYLGFWATCQAGTCNSTLVPGCGIEGTTIANATVGSVNYYKNRYYSDSGEVCRRFHASRNITIAALIIGLLTVIACCFPGSFWFTLLFSVVTAALLFTSMLLLITIRETLQAYVETIKGINLTPSNTENPFFNVVYDYAGSFWVLVVAFVISVFIPLVILIKRDRNSHRDKEAKEPLRRST